MRRARPKHDRNALEEEIAAKLEDWRVQFQACASFTTLWGQAAVRRHESGQEYMFKFSLRVERKGISVEDNLKDRLELEQTACVCSLFDLNYLDHDVLQIRRAIFDLYRPEGIPRANSNRDPSRAHPNAARALE